MPTTETKKVKAQSSQHDCRICGGIIVEGTEAMVTFEREHDDDRYYWFPQIWRHWSCYTKEEVKEAL